MEDKIADLLMQALNNIYCDTCCNYESDEYNMCDYCHRKSMGWQISENYAHVIANEIQKIYGGDDDEEL